jgi:hypothetical protein
MLDMASIEVDHPLYKPVTIAAIAGFEVDVCRSVCNSF